MVARQSDVTNSPEPDANSEPPSAGRAMHAPTLPSTRPEMSAGAPGRAVFTRVSITTQTEVSICQRALPAALRTGIQNGTGHKSPPLWGGGPSIARSGEEKDVPFLLGTSLQISDYSALSSAGGSSAGSSFRFLDALTKPISSSPVMVSLISRNSAISWSRTLFSVRIRVASA